MTDIWTFLPYNGSARYRGQGDRGGDSLALNPGKHASQPATETLNLGPFCTDPVTLDWGAIWRLWFGNGCLFPSFHIPPSLPLSLSPVPPPPLPHSLLSHSPLSPTLFNDDDGFNNASLWALHKNHTRLIKFNQNSHQLNLLISFQSEIQNGCFTSKPKCLLIATGCTDFKCSF